MICVHIANVNVYMHGSQKELKGYELMLDLHMCSKSIVVVQFVECHELATLYTIVTRRQTKALMNLIAIGILQRNEHPMILLLRFLCMRATPYLVWQSNEDCRLDTIVKVKQLLPCIVQ